jgi:hypothetical protein
LENQTLDYRHCLGFALHDGYLIEVKEYVYPVTALLITFDRVTCLTSSEYLCQTPFLKVYKGEYSFEIVYNRNPILINTLTIKTPP